MTIEDYKDKIYELNREICRLQTALDSTQSKLDSAEFRIRRELEPRLAAERRAYDRNLSDW
ncbi:hypothetical protein FACS1894216_05020 [Synergistales bacterium]|nr:hypothetical protein FACS1894216_05020 [Synergistales bacterium]